MLDSNGPPRDADAWSECVYVGHECPCGGDSECEVCEGAGEVGEVVALETFRVMAGVEGPDKPPSLV